MGSASVSRPVHFTGPKKSTVQEGGLKSARRDEGSGAVIFVVGQGERERDNDEESKEKERKRNQRSCRREGRITFMKRSTFIAAQQ